MLFGEPRHAWIANRRFRRVGVHNPTLVNNGVPFLERARRIEIADSGGFLADSRTLHQATR